MSLLKQTVKAFIYTWNYLFHHSCKSKIIYYHDVGCKYTDMGTEREIVEAHISIVRESGFEFVPEIAEPKNQIMVCFDDGWKGLYDNKDLFISTHIYPTVFLAVDLIDKEGYMNSDQIQELIALGFHFECHTWTHTGLHTYHGDDLKHEMVASRIELQNMFGLPFDSICFPQGNYSAEVIKASKDAGYLKLYSSNSGGYYDLLSSDGIICRNLVQCMPPCLLKYYLQGDSKYLQTRDKKRMCH